MDNNELLKKYGLDLSNESEFPESDPVDQQNKVLSSSDVGLDRVLTNKEPDPNINPIDNKIVEEPSFLNKIQSFMGFDPSKRGSNVRPLNEPDYSSANPYLDEGTYSKPKSVPQSDFDSVSLRQAIKNENTLGLDTLPYPLDNNLKDSSLNLQSSILNRSPASLDQVQTKDSNIKPINKSELEKGSSEKKDKIEELLKQYQAMKDKESALVREQGKPNALREFANAGSAFAEVMANRGKFHSMYGDNAGKVIGGTKISPAGDILYGSEDKQKEAELKAAGIDSSAKKEMLEQAIKIKKDKQGSWAPITGTDLAINSLTGETKKLDGITPKQKLTEGQKKVDMDYAKTYSKWASEGRDTLINNMNSLDNAVDRLKKAGTTVSGNVVGRLPDFARTEESRTIEADMNRLIVDTLRPTLGAQFTEKENQLIRSLSYDPKVSPEANIEKIHKLKTIIDQKVKTNEKLASHFEDKGSLVGLKSSEGAAHLNEPSSSEIKRKTQDGRTAIFDSNKKFLRYE
jgi:hypothetical protein